MATAQIDKFLARESTSGDYDSTGTFRVQLGRAHNRLGSDFAQRYPGGYLLKVVQAGVLMGCSSLDLQVNRDAVLLRLNCEPAPNTLARMKAGLAHLRPSSTDPFELLGFAMLAGLSEQVEQVRLTARDGSELTELTIDHRGVRWERGPDSSPGGMVVRFQRPAVCRASELALVRQRCGYCPVPITVNGERLDGQGWPGERPWRLSHASKTLAPDGFMLFEQYLPAEEDARTLSLPEPEERALQSSVFLHQGLVPTGRCAGAVGIPASLEGSGKVVWVQHGVSLEPDKLDLGCPGSVAVIEASHLKTDLSGFRLVRDQSFEEEVGRIRHHLKSGAAQLGQELPRLRTGFVRRSLTFRLGVVAALLGILGMIVGATAGSAAILVQSVAQALLGVVFVAAEFRENGPSERAYHEHVRSVLNRL